MGVEYKHYLIPRPNSFRPEPEVLLRFIERLQTEGWLWRPAIPSEYVTIRTRPASQGGRYRSAEAVPLPIELPWLEQMTAHDFELRFDVQGFGFGDQPARYPFVNKSPVSREDTYYEIKIDSSIDYVYHTSEMIEPFKTTTCRCGGQLEYALAYEGGIVYAIRLKTECPGCRRAFDPSTLEAPYRNGFTGDYAAPIRGGVSYLFAVIVDCGSCIPEADTEVSIRPELKELCERHFGTPFYDVGDFY
jgi:hypothetical protein